MCGRFSQSMAREEYLSLLADEAERDIPYAPEPIGRFDVAPGTKVLLLSEYDEQLHLAPVICGYTPGWWDKPQLINAHSETAATSRILSHSGNMAVQFALLMAGTNGKRKAIRSNPTSFIGPMVSRYLWRRLAARHSKVEMKQKVS